MAQPPSFPFYPADWLLGTLTFSLAEDGAYLRLVMHQWNAGSVPGDDLAAVARILRVTEREARPIWATISAKFVRGDDGLWRNARVEKQRAEKVRYHEAQAEKGRRSAERRANHGTNHGTNHGSTAVDPRLQPEGQPEPNLSLALVSVPTEQREPAPKVSRYGHALVPKRDMGAFWEGPIFNIPDGWARRVLKASNGKAVGSDVVQFAQQLTAKLERDGGEAPALGFLQWLDTEWSLYRQPVVSDGYRPAAEFIEQQRRDAALACSSEEAKAILAEARAKMRTVAHG